MVEALRAGPAAQTGSAVAVVHRALLRIPKNLVGLGNLLEPGLRLR
jgi:hypothetical protein